MDEPVERLTAILADKFEIPASSVTPEATLGTFGLDSLALVELAITLEEEWGLRWEEGAISEDTPVERLAAALRASGRWQAGEADTGRAAQDRPAR